MVAGLGLLATHKRSDPAYRKITADEFLAMDFGADKRFQLDDGVIVMMAGGTEAHAWVQPDTLLWLRRKLRGARCRPYGPIWPSK